MRKRGWKFIKMKIEELTNFCRKKKRFNNNVCLLYEEINSYKVHPIKTTKARRGIRGITLLFL
jgi:hypothetical protein